MKMNHWLSVAINITNIQFSIIRSKMIICRIDLPCKVKEYNLISFSLYILYQFLNGKDLNLN